MGAVGSHCSILVVLNACSCGCPAAVISYTCCCCRPAVVPAVHRVPPDGVDEGLSALGCLTGITQLLLLISVKVRGSGCSSSA